MKKQSGRSMIEMLGVLVLIGVLSVAALFGFTYAMNRHKANETIHDVMLRATNVPMIDEYYVERTGDYEWKFAGLPEDGQLGSFYTMHTLVSDLNEYVYRVVVSDVPKRVCRQVLSLNPTDIDAIYVEGDKPSDEECPNELNTMTFYFDEFGIGGNPPEPPLPIPDNDCVSKATYFYGDNCEYKAECCLDPLVDGCPPECTPKNCPTAPVCGECEEYTYDTKGCPVGCEKKTCNSCMEGKIEVGTDACGCPICQSEDCPDIGPNPGCSELIEDTTSLPGEVCYTWGPTQLTTKQTGACCDEGTVDCCPLTEDCSCNPEENCVECFCPDPGESPCEGATLEDYDYFCPDGRVKTCQKWDSEGCSCIDNNDCSGCSQCVNGVCGPDEMTTAQTGECCDMTINCCPWKGECPQKCDPLSCDAVVDTVPPGEEACYEPVEPGAELCGEVCPGGYKKKECKPCDGGSRQIGTDECGCPICEPCAQDEFSCGQECCVAANQFCCGESCCSVGHACCDGVCCGEDQTCGNNGTCCSPAAPCGECEVEATDANGCPICEPDPNCCACPDPGESPCEEAVLEDYDYSCTTGETLTCQRWNVDECSCTTDEDCGACYECIGGACVYQEGGLVCGEACCDTSTHSCCGETCCPLGQECCGETCCGVGETCNNGGCEPKESPCPEGSSPVRPGAANAFDSGEVADDTKKPIWCCNEGYVSVHKCRGVLSDCLISFTWRGSNKWLEEEKCCRDTTDYGEAFSFGNIVLGYQATEPDCCYSSDHPDVIGWPNHEYCCPDRGYPYYAGGGGISCHPVKAEIKLVKGYPKDPFEWDDWL